ncbi:MAG: glycosyltransferase, partial [Syntrophomonadaceae bacterium]|nr:glycosyltransferase [Syntrophomonadaceae bacterium]
RQQRIDVVHTHASFAGRLAARLTGVPAIVYTRHRLDWEAPRRGIRKWAYILLNRFTSRRVIAVSEAVREALVAEGIPRGRISLIYNGIDVEQFRRQAAQSDCRSRLAAPGQKVVGVVGRLEPEKGHRYFLEAAVSIREAVPEAVFLVVGDGSLAGELKEMARRLGISEQVLVFTGYREDIPQLTAAMDVVVVPSLSEAFGFTLIEGMCLGRPCVASAVGGMREIAEDGRTALLVPPGDASAIAEKVVFLLQHPECADALGQAAAGEVERRFSARTMVDQITDLYYQIVGPTD